jgi:hypothetical protein
MNSIAWDALTRSHQTPVLSILVLGDAAMLRKVKLVNENLEFDTGKLYLHGKSTNKYLKMK